MFYLWGAEASRWEKMRLFAKAYDRIIAAVAAADIAGSRPFIYRVDRRGTLKRVALP